MLARNFDAILFDVGGVFLVPDPTVLGPLMRYHGGDDSVDGHVRAHYAAMKAKSAAGSTEKDWGDYDVAYVQSLGVADHEVELAAKVLGLTRNAYTWRFTIDANVAALAALVTAEVPVGIVSNASGQIELLLQRGGVCQAGDGPHTPVRVIVDSFLVGVAKPDPRIFDFALEHFPGVDRSRIAYVGDSDTMDIGGARAAGLHPILVDPYDDHAGADFQRIQSLWDLLS